MINIGRRWRYYLIILNRCPANIFCWSFRRRSILHTCCPSPSLACKKFTMYQVGKNCLSLDSSSIKFLPPISFLSHCWFQRHNYCCCCCRYLWSGGTTKWKLQTYFQTDGLKWQISLSSHVLNVRRKKKVHTMINRIFFQMSNIHWSRFDQSCVDILRWSPNSKDKNLGLYNKTFDNIYRFFNLNRIKGLMTTDGGFMKGYTTKL